MKRQLMAFVAACAAGVALADPNDPQVSLVSAAQNESRVLKVSYTLDEPAIVTFDVKTNGVSIGGANLKLAYGDVHRVVEAGAHTLFWPAYEAWPEHTTKRDGEFSVTVTAWATNAPPDYMVVKLVGDDRGARTFYTVPEQLPGAGGVTNDMYKTDYLVMRRIPAAGKTFRMGSPASEPEHKANEILHYVSLTNDFYMSVFELTQGQFKNVIGSEPTTYSSYFYEPTHPVDWIVYNSFRGSSALWPRDGHDVDPSKNLYTFRTELNLPTLDLPTEAEWEFACRAGTLTGRYNGTEYSASVADIAWVGADRTQPHAVGLLEPNGYGLYDMYGNVDEYCLDYYAADYATEGSTVIAPQGPSSGSDRVIRGTGSWWSSNGSQARSAFRQNYTAAGPWMCVGYRLVCTF